jgi:FtsH Extracellular
MPVLEPKQRQDKLNRPREPDGRQQLRQNLWLWWLIFTALLMWNLLAWWPSPKDVVSIPYSTLLAQIQANNVAKVHIVGDDITGEFVKPLLWPERNQHPRTPLPPHPSASPASSLQHGADSGENGKPARREAQRASASTSTRYPKFHTIFPSAMAIRI